MGLLSKLISPPFSGDGSNVDKYSEDYSSNSSNNSDSNSSSSDYYNCTVCGGMGRTGGEKSYSTIGGACTNCNGTGHID